MAYEGIDEAPDKLSGYEALVQSVIDYLSGDMTDVKARLKLERDIKKYADSNTSNWLLNLIISVFKDVQLAPGSREETSKEEISSEETEDGT